MAVARVHAFLWAVLDYYATLWFLTTMYLMTQVAIPVQPVQKVFSSENEMAFITTY